MLLLHHTADLASFAPRFSKKPAPSHASVFFSHWRRPAPRLFIRSEKFWTEQHVIVLHLSSPKTARGSFSCWPNIYPPTIGQVRCIGEIQPAERILRIYSRETPSAVSKQTYLILVGVGWRLALFNRKREAPTSIRVSFLFLERSL